MDSQQILLNKEKNVNSIDKDQHIAVKLVRNNSEVITPISSAQVDFLDLADKERQSSRKFYIHGTIELLSLFNGVRKTYSTIKDFFEPYKVTYNNYIKFTDIFDIYLVKPVNDRIYYMNGSGDMVETNDNNIVSGNTTEYYAPVFKIICDNTNIKLSQMSFQKSIFNDTIYSFTIDSINLENEINFFGNPIQNLYLYFVFKPINGEVISYKTFKSNERINFVPEIYYNDQEIYGNFVYFKRENFNESIVSDQEYRISSHPVVSNLSLIFKYNPFIKIDLFQYYPDIEMSYNELEAPLWAQKVNNKYYWKERVDYGVIDDELGLDYPFINNHHYIFKDVKLEVMPDLSDNFTKSVFNNIIPGLSRDLIIREGNFIPKC